MSTVYARWGRVLIRKSFAVLLVFRVSALNYSHSNDEINLFPVICAWEDEKGNVVQSVVNI